jgi:Tfp pilus assembly PilM family ATPase
MTANRRNVRTGIDLGTTSVKLVRGHGGGRLEHVTHAGVEPLAGTGGGRDAQETAAALRRLLERMRLRGSQLGLLATAVGGPEVVCREVVTASMNDDVLERALPFEARKYLDLESMKSPVLDFQVLGRLAEAVPGVGPQMRVLFAAAPREARNFPVEVLRLAGLEPDVVDLEPLAELNALAAIPGGAGTDEQAVGLLDLGGSRAVLHLWSRAGGLLSRDVGEPAPGVPPTDEGETYGAALAGPVRESATFFRGRHRRDVARLYLAGGGARFKGVQRALARALEVPCLVFDPLQGLSVDVEGCIDAAEAPMRFVTACGLCRWWDQAH